MVIYANGFGSTNVPVQSGSITQSGTLSPLPVIKIGGVTATRAICGPRRAGGISVQRGDSFVAHQWRSTRHGGLQRSIHAVRHVDHDPQVTVMKRARLQRVRWGYSEVADTMDSWSEPELLRTALRVCRYHQHQAQNTGRRNRTGRAVSEVAGWNLRHRTPGSVRLDPEERRRFNRRQR